MTEPELRQEIEQTRAQLGATVEALAAKADVPARVRGKVADMRGIAQVKAAAAAERVTTTATGLSRRARPGELARHRWPLAVAVCLLVVGGAAVWQWRKA